MNTPLLRCRAVFKQRAFPKTFWLLPFLCLAASFAAAQGTVTFANDSATAITNPVTNQRFQVGEIVVALYGSTTLGLGQDDSSLTQVGAGANLSSPGRFSDGTRFIGAANSTVTLQVRAWATAFATWNEAVAANAIRGKSTMWEQQTGGGLVSPQSITGPGKFQGFITIPEPSTTALALSALATLFLYRFARRKSS